MSLCKMRQNVMNSEMSYVFKRGINPFRTINILIFFFHIAIKKVIKSLKVQAIFYPNDLKKIYRKCNITKYLYNDTGEIREIPSKVSNLKIKLASGFFEIEREPNWNLEYADQEQEVSLHRWGWLLHFLTHKPNNFSCEEGLFLVSDWCRKVVGNSGSMAFQSYSVGERICNAIIFSYLTNSRIPIAVQEKLQDMAVIVIKGIEYAWFKTFGNHIINNARAIYFCGQYFGIIPYMQFSKVIIRKELCKLIYADGFIREGSSHYQFLITRWLLELNWLAKKSCDIEMQELLAPFLQKMIEKCYFFLVKKSGMREYLIPLIGDVSPDFAWDWLVDLPWSKLANDFYSPMLPSPIQEGWGALFGRSRDNNINTSFYQDGSYKVQMYSESGWYRIDWNELAIVWHVEPQGSPGFSSHGHCDIASFSLYWKGEEVLIDPGRLNYQWDHPMGVYGVSAAAHNSLKIDGHDPFIYFQRSHYPGFYLHQRVKVGWEEKKDRFIFTIEHEGFSRLNKGIVIHKRIFCVSLNGLIVEDHFFGKNTHQIETFFQFAPSVSIQSCNQIENKFNLVLSNARGGGSFSIESSEYVLKSSIYQGETSDRIAGWYFPRYGQKIPATTLIFSSELQFPSVLKYTMEFIRE